MPLLKARVRNGRLVLDEPTDLPDGNIVYLQRVDGARADGVESEGDEAASPDDPGHNAAWAEVIDRRLQDALDGRVELVDANVVTARVRDAVARRRG
ncbi:MAG: hypothetical protein H7138_28070 [Myxococcales bacterium]|nr:hypothetical protein [Myxococcales bacterium]